MTDELLRLEGLAVHFPVRGGFADAILRAAEARGIGTLLPG